MAFFERLTGRLFLRELRPSYLIFSDGFAMGAVSERLKRLVDVVLAAVGLLLAAPILALAALGIRVDSRGPIVFCQERLGKNGRVFRAWKMRTMTADAEDGGARWAEEDDSRTTRVGKLLRKTHIDELPQLWNVLVGEMSLVGPRPERPEFYEMLCEKYPYFVVRGSVRPGITGWAQIRQGYVNDVEAMEEKLALDMYYLKYRSLAMDLLILWRTTKTVLLFRGQ